MTTVPPYIHTGISVCHMPMWNSGPEASSTVSRSIPCRSAWTMACSSKLSEDSMDPFGSPSHAIP